jgi:hypothetical protein
MIDPPPRTAVLVLVERDGRPIGRLPPVPVETPWWNDIGPLVDTVRATYGIEVTVLRLLATERDAPPGGEVTYVAETRDDTGALPLTPCADTLTDDSLRLPYARPGGPAADVAWALSALEGAGRAVAEPPRQVRTWNLSSIWRLPTTSGDAWLKVVPPFFGHEPAILGRLAGEPVPRLIASDGPRMLLEDIPGTDLYDADPSALIRMVRLLVGLQARWIDRVDEALLLGLPDWRLPALEGAIASVVERHAAELSRTERSSLEHFLRTMPGRASAIAACGIPDTLVHGDFHPGNHRGDSDRLTLLDWGDSGVGHPLLDQTAFIDRSRATAHEDILDTWHAAWSQVVPGSDPGRATTLLRPLAAARQAVIYRRFLDGIEQSERIYHRSDPAHWLRRVVAIVDREGRSG